MLSPEECPAEPYRLFLVLKAWVVFVQEHSFMEKAGKGRGEGVRVWYRLGEVEQALPFPGWFGRWDAGWTASGSRNSQHLMWQWKVYSSLVFWRPLWVSSLRVESFALHVKGTVATLSPHIPWHHTPARHSHGSTSCALAQNGSPGTWELLEMSFELPYLHLK